MTEQEILARLRRLEDHQAIAELLASYGPSVDSGDADGAARLWTVDGTYDVESWQMRGRRGVREMVGSQSHQNLVAQGCCHFLGPAAITVDGDSAVAVCESLVLLRHNDSAESGGEGHYRVWRATANHFVLSRIDGNWQITTRTSRVLDGDQYAHALLRAGLAGAATPVDDRG